MPKFYFSCGQIHRHDVGGGKVWDKDSLIEVNAERADLACIFVQSRFGPKYASDYPEKELPELLKFAKNGIVAKFKA